MQAEILQREPLFPWPPAPRPRETRRLCLRHVLPGPWSGFPSCVRDPQGRSQPPKLFCPQSRGTPAPEKLRSGWSPGKVLGTQAGNVDLEQVAGPVTALTDASVGGCRAHQEAVGRSCKAASRTSLAGQGKVRRCSERPQAQEEGPERVSSLAPVAPVPPTTSQVCPPGQAGPSSPFPGNAVPWQPSAHGWRVLCQELRKQGDVGSGGGRPGTCSEGAGPHLSQGVGTGCGAARTSANPCPRLSSHVDQQTVCRRPPKRWWGLCRCCRDERNTKVF